MNHTTNEVRQHALAALYERGAHLFPFRVERNPEDPKDKKYTMPDGWQAHRAELPAVLAAEHVGLMPGSLGLTVPDVDVHGLPHERQERGNAGCEAVMAWAGETPCIVRTPSRGAHLFYRTDDPARGKQSVPVPGMKKPLEVFGATGFVELYDPARVLKHLDALPVFAGAMTPPPAAAPGVRPGTRGRGHEDGDRNKGLFVKVRSAIERDQDPGPAVSRAVAAARLAGLDSQEIASTTISGCVKGMERRAPVLRIVDPGDVPEPEPEPEPEDVAAVIAAWRAVRRPEAMPLPPEPEGFVGEPAMDFEQPCDQWELAAHWTRSHQGDWRCEIGLDGRRRWFRFLDGWRETPEAFVLNDIRSHAREHFYSGNKKGELVNNPHAGSANTIVKQSLEAASALMLVHLAIGAMDADPFFTGLPDGQLVDARSRAIVPASRDVLVAKRAAQAPSAWAGSEWDRLMRFAFPCPLERLWFGCFNGRAFIGGRGREGLFTPGAKLTAKSTIVEALIYAFGDYGMVTDAGTLTKKHGGGSSSVHTQDSTRAQMAGRRLIGINESDEDSAINAKSLKQLISDDRITGRMMGGGNTKEVEPTWSFLFGMNWEDFPMLDPDSDAAWSRIVVLPIDRPIPPEQRRDAFIRILRQPEEQAAMIGWLLDHGWLWAEHGMPPQSQRMQRARDELRSASRSPLDRFLDETCQRGPDLRIAFSDLRAAFVDWRRQQGEPDDLSAHRMAADLRRKPGISVRQTGGRRTVVFGIGLPPGQ